MTCASIQCPAMYCLSACIRGNRLQNQITHSTILPQKTFQITTQNHVPLVTFLDYDGENLVAESNQTQ